MAAFVVLKGLLIIPVGSMGPFKPGNSPFQAVGEGKGTCGLCPKSRASATLNLWFQF